MESWDLQLFCTGLQFGIQNVLLHVCMTSIITHYCVASENIHTPRKDGILV